MSNPVRGEQSWGAELMAWVARTLPGLLNDKQAGDESAALLELWEQWEQEHPSETGPAAQLDRLTQDETPETE